MIDNIDRTLSVVDILYCTVDFILLTFVLFSRRERPKKRFVSRIRKKQNPRVYRGSRGSPKRR